MGVSSKDGSDGSEGSEGKEGGNDGLIAEMLTCQQADLSIKQPCPNESNIHHNDVYKPPIAPMQVFSF